MDAYAHGLKLSAAGRHAEAIVAFEAALAARPQDTATLFALGNTARALGLDDAAQSFFAKVLALEPLRVEAVVNLANLLRERGQCAAAEALIAPALARGPASAELWLTRGLVRRAQNDLPGARAAFAEALSLRPDYAPALANLADCLADLGDIDAALALYDRLLARDRGQPQARLNRAILHLLRGDLKAGWRDYAARLDLPGKAPRADHRLKPWDGERLKNVRLLVTAEQGVGDQLMFASMIPDLAARAAAAGGRIVLECDPRLAALFARSFPDVAVAAADWHSRDGAVQARYGWLKALGGANAAVALGTLARHLRRDLAAFPAPHAYLRPDPDEAARWRRWAASLGGGRRIGICWRSGKMAGGRSLQFAPLQAWAAWLRDVPGDIVCLQYDAQAEEVAALADAAGKTIHVPAAIDQKRELDRAAALTAAMDVVVSAPTAVSWLAAGAGVATCKLVYDTSWTAFGRPFEPFAPAARIVRPDRPGDWAQAFARLAVVAG